MRNPLYLRVPSTERCTQSEHDFGGIAKQKFRYINSCYAGYCLSTFKYIRAYTIERVPVLSNAL